jgi:hypothetical protein
MRQKIPPFRARYVIQFTVPIIRTLTKEQDGATGHITIGDITMECPVEVEIDLDSVAWGMGASACKNRTGRCVDGFTVVKKAGTPKEVSRRMR